MKITAIETIRLGEFPNLLWLHIHTDQGLVGLGETFFGPRAIEAHIHETVAPLLFGKPALQMDRHARTLQNQYLGFTGTRRGDACRIGGGHRAVGPVRPGDGAADLSMPGRPVARAGPDLQHLRRLSYIRAASGQKTTTGASMPRRQAAVRGPGRFLHRADELAHSLLEQGITAMKIWPFDFAAEATEGRSITAAELEQALVPFRKIRDAVGGRMDIMAELHSLWTPPAAERVLRALAEFDPFWVEDPIKMVNADLLAEPAGAHPRANLRQRDACDAAGVPRIPAGRCGGRGDARSVLVRRHRRGEEDRDAGGGLGPAGCAARLHRAGGADRLGACVAELSEHPGAGDGARIHQRLVPGGADRSARYSRWVCLSVAEGWAWYGVAAGTAGGGRLRTADHVGVRRAAKQPSWAAFNCHCKERSDAAISCPCWWTLTGGRSAASRLALVRNDRGMPYRTSSGTTLMLLNGEPLISFVLTTV